MSAGQKAAAILLATLLLVSFGASLRDGDSYARQHRDMPRMRASKEFPLGTDDLGRDRLARLVHATAVSLALAPAAALTATLIAALIGGLAGFLDGGWDRWLTRAIDLMLALPWLFLLIAVRAVLPLNVPAVTSLLVTYGLLAVLGWAGPARVVRSAVRVINESDFVLQDRAAGIGSSRLFWRHIVPNLWPTLLAQFLTSVPIFGLAEANLGLLGFSVSGYPTWGNMLREVAQQVVFRPEALAPLTLMTATLLCFKAVLPIESARI